METTGRTPLEEFIVELLSSSQLPRSPRRLRRHVGELQRRGALLRPPYLDPQSMWNNGLF